MMEGRARVWVTLAQFWVDTEYDSDDLARIYLRDSWAALRKRIPS